MQPTKRLNSIGRNHEVAFHFAIGLHLRWNIFVRRKKVNAVMESMKARVETVEMPLLEKAGKVKSMRFVNAKKGIVIIMDMAILRGLRFLC